MKALVDADGNSGDPDYHNLKQGNPAQERKAKVLHQLAGVPEGPCGLPELERFQTALPGYQINVMSIDPPHMIIYADPPRRTRSFVSSKRVNTTTAAIPLVDSSADPTSAMTVTVGLIMMI